MTESEYVDTTNLAIVRAAMRLLENRVWSEKNQKDMTTAFKALHKVANRLSKKVDVGGGICQELEP